MIKRALVLLIFAFILAGCLHSKEDRGEDDCDDEMDDVRAERGAPEEVNTYDSGDYHSVDWWYWSQGINYTFTWGENVHNCDVSTYTFDPIN